MHVRRSESVREVQLTHWFKELKQSNRMAYSGQLDEAPAASQIGITCAELAKEFMQEIRLPRDCGDDYEDEKYWKEQLAVVLQILQDLVRLTYMCKHCTAVLSCA